MQRRSILALALQVVVGCKLVAPTREREAGHTDVASPLAKTAANRPTGPPGRSPEPQPDAPLAEFCGGAGATPCPTLTTHLAKLRAEQCVDGSTPPTRRACGAFAQVDVDYGIVGYVHFFDGAGTLVGVVAHLYEYGGSKRYGAVPECKAEPATSVCAERRAGSAAR